MANSGDLEYVPWICIILMRRKQAGTIRMKQTPGVITSLINEYDAYSSHLQEEEAPPLMIKD